jgi:formate dehydrogenase iron-sulfur subunit
MSKAMLTDLTRCTGCRSCQVACKQWNGLPAEITRQTGTYENPPRLSAKTWTWVQVREVEHDGKLVWSFARRQCMHCQEPACAAACIVGALRKTAEGPVVYDDYKCIGCRYCTLACPFGVPTFDWDKAVPFIHKCEMCADRQVAGMIPACAKACPPQAIAFGERDELLQEARARIQARPDKYVDHIYGEKEVGGTSMLYISNVSFDKIGFPTLGPEPIPRYADVAMAAVPPAIAVVSAAMAGIYWFTRRRDRLMKEAAGNAAEHRPESNQGKEV